MCDAIDKLDLTIVELVLVHGSSSCQESPTGEQLTFTSHGSDSLIFVALGFPVDL